MTMAISSRKAKKGSKINGFNRFHLGILVMRSENPGSIVFPPCKLIIHILYVCVNGFLKRQKDRKKDSMKSLITNVTEASDSLNLAAGQVSSSSETFMQIGRAHV